MSSRLLFAFSLVAGLASITSLPSLASAEQQFARRPAPVAADMDQVSKDMPPDLVVDRASVHAALARVRATNLASFRAYQKAGVFPTNTVKDGLTNVWKDADGHICAAATIIWRSGNTALVDRVAEQTNLIRLADVKQGPLMDWMLTSGLTQEELAAIQRPFQRVDPTTVKTTAAEKQRAAETARLAKLYVEVEKTIVASEAKSLDVATDRLMKHMDLAAKLVESQQVIED